MKKRVYLVDDHPMVRERLAQMINQEADLMVCGESAQAGAALERINAVLPDVVVLDISLERSSGLNLLKDLQVMQPELPVLVLSMHDESLYGERCLKAGARGYVNKQEATTSILTAIRQVLKGQIHMSAGLAATVVRQYVQGRERKLDAPGVNLLTDRELEVFQLLGQGYGTRRIADELHLGIKTVESYRSRIKEKLGLEDASQLVHQAVKWVIEHRQPEG
jgi:DNA-binding NarL/FixJ family response regulator